MVKWKHDECPWGVACPGLANAIRWRVRLIQFTTSMAREVWCGVLAMCWLYFLKRKWISLRGFWVGSLNGLFKQMLVNFQKKNWKLEALFVILIFNLNRTTNKALSQCTNKYIEINFPPKKPTTNHNCPLRGMQLHWQKEKNWKKRENW